MQEETNTSISIGDPEDGKAIVEVFADDKEGMQEALRRIDLIAYPPVPEVKVYNGKVKNIVTFGAFLEILPEMMLYYIFLKLLMSEWRK